MIKVNFLSVSLVENHFEVVTDSGTYYYRVFTNTITFPYPKTIGGTYAPEYVTQAAGVAIKKVYNILASVHILKLNAPELTELSKHDKMFTSLRHKKYGNIDQVVLAANAILN